MGTRNIAISDEAYARLAALKGPKESFTDVINRIADGHPNSRLDELLPGTYPATPNLKAVA